MPASSGKIPIGARLTWLRKAYFTLYWPASLHFLPFPVYTHPSFSFVTPLPLRFMVFLYLINLQRRFECAEWRDRCFFFCWVIALQHLGSNSLLYRNEHIALSLKPNGAEVKEWEHIVKLLQLWQSSKLLPLTVSRAVFTHAQKS